MVGVAQIIEPRQDLVEEKEVKGTVHRILYANGVWGLILVRRPNGEEVKAKGNILPLTPQTEVTLTGRWVPDERRPGEQLFDVEDIEVEIISDRRGLIAKLAELPDVGKRRATAIVEKFGDDVVELLRILRDEPGRVAAEIDGITERRAQLISLQIKDGWGNQFARDVKLLRVLPKWIVDRALRRWPGKPTSQETAIDVLYRDPYRLIEINGVGFKRADKAAIDTGITLDDPRRHVAALQYLLDQATQGDGHTWISFDQAVAWARKEQIDGIRREEFWHAADIAQEQGYVEVDPQDENWMAPVALVDAEEAIARRAKQLSQEVRCDDVLDLTARYGLNEQQAEAVQLAQTRRFLILTGGPGTGKTYTLQAILDAFEQRMRSGSFRGWGKIGLCAPTGKAAVRMSEVTNRPAQTVHSFLSYKPDLDVFEFGGGNPHPSSLIVCDEASMLDTRLAGQLISAVPHDCHLILVGDVDQLPSVGPGKVLSDLIESGAAPVVRLTQTMRQAEDSAIVKNAHALINGQDIHVDNNLYRDFKFFEVEAYADKRQEREEIAQKAAWAHNVVRENLGHNLDDIQILTPQKAGEIGTGQLNQMLREQLNPAAPRKPEIEVAKQSRTLRQGDRVIQTQNNYDLEVMNGQIGTILEVEAPDPTAKKKGSLLVRFDEQIVRYPESELGQLHHAYAITVHKSQGSEWPVVIIPVSTSHAKTLTRRLLYTAITRGKKLVVLVGTQKALRWAQKNVEDAQRQTRLLQLLGGEG